MTVWIYVDTSKQVGDRDHLKVFASEIQRPPTEAALLLLLRGFHELNGSFDHYFCPDVAWEFELLGFGLLAS